MLIFVDKGLTYLANPKSGSTAVHMALQRHADIVFKGTRRHMNAERYHRLTAPFLKAAYGAELETVAVMRHPEDQLRSWYKYRSRPALEGKRTSTAGTSFDDFVRSVIANKRKRFVRMGNQMQFLANQNDQVLVNHLFDYDNQDGLITFLSERLELEVKLEPYNVSPQMDAPLSDEVAQQLRSLRAKEYALYHALKSANGYLRRG